MPCKASRDRQVMVAGSDKLWSTGEGNGKPLQHSFLEKSLNSMKGQNHMKLKNEARRSVGAQYATGEGGEVAPGGMKRLSQSRNKAHLWMCLAVKVKSNAVRMIPHSNLEC